MNGTVVKIFASLVSAAVSVLPAFADDAIPVSALAGRTHFHGLSVDAADSSLLYLATHHGLYAVGADGMARRKSDTTNDFMGFTPHPTDPTVLFASGHPPSGGNLGFLESRDAGRSWRKLADGVGGPVDFHQMDVSKADPKVIYGVFRGLQRSADGGRSWSLVGPAPEGIIDLAASARAADTLYAATQRGLMRSTDGGRSWSAAYIVQRAATLVRATRDGTVYAFVVGTGLLRAKEDGLSWAVVNNKMGGYVIHLAVDPRDAARLFVVTVDPKTHAQALVASRDGGASWTPLGR